MREIQQGLLPLVGTRRLFWTCDGKLICGEIVDCRAQFVNLRDVREITSYTLASPTMGVSWGGSVMQQLPYVAIARSAPKPATGWGAA